MKATAFSVDGSTSSTALRIEVWQHTRERDVADGWLKKEHKLGAFKPIGDTLYQVVFELGQPVALLVWSASSWHLKDRDQWIGWDARLRVERLKLVVNNVRFLVLEQSRRPQLASQALAAAVRQLPAQWKEQFGYEPLLAETFTDPEPTAGTSYKAAGWTPLGFTQGHQRHRCEFYLPHGRPKRLWIKPLHPQARERLIARQLPTAQQAGQAHPGRCALGVPQLSSLRQAFLKVPDPRAKNTVHRLPTVLTLLAVGLLCGAKHLSQILRAAQRLDQRRRRRLNCRRKPGTQFYQVPGYDVFREVLIRLDLEAFVAVLNEWLQAQAGTLPRSLAMDGKVIREHLGCILSVVDQQEGVPLAATVAPGKGKELAAGQQALAQMDLAGQVVSGDPLHCQRKVAQLIVRDKGADYVLGIKGNQKKMLQYAKTLTQGQSPLLN
jgi:hypothetical protein